MAQGTRYRLYGKCQQHGGEKQFGRFMGRLRRLGMTVVEMEEVHSDFNPRTPDPFVPPKGQSVDCLGCGGAMDTIITAVARDGGRKAVGS